MQQHNYHYSVGDKKLVFWGAIRPLTQSSTFMIHVFKIISLAVVSLLLANDLVGQKEDYQWILENYSQTTHPCWQGTVMDFSTFPMSMSAFTAQTFMQRTSATICDDDGNMVYYTNGLSIRNSNFELLENGDGLNPGQWADDFQYEGYPVPQGTIFTQMGDITWMFHTPIEDFQDPEWGFTLYSPELYVTKMQNGELSYKNESIIQDSLAQGHLTITAHANGRDKWLLSNKYETNGFYKVLIAQDTFIIDTQDIDNNEFIHGVGYAKFSPNGTKYIIQHNRFSTEGQFINIYDFDRCTGELEMTEAFNILDGALTVSLAVSPNSKYLYVISENYIYQYDLESDDIESTQIIVAEWDNLVIQGLFPTAFGYGQLAPDGKIYISTNGDTKFMHLIHQPNKQGVECNVEVRGLDLLSYGRWSIPNHPFHRLGPLDGSPCDTLGIDNIPMSGFTWEATGLEVDFTNNSYYEPAEWNWDFEGLV